MKTTIKAPRQWAPPHCPNHQCAFHHSPNGWRFRRAGYYKRNTPPYHIQRYRCMHCRKSFSRQTFRNTYWLKRPDLLKKVFELTVNGMANRQIARVLKCAPSTVDNLIARIGRICVLYHLRLTKGASPPGDIVFDGLVSYEYSKYFRVEILTAVDNDSSFIEFFALAQKRRSGQMTERQKERRAELEAKYGRPDPRAVEKGTREVLEFCLQGAQEVTLRTDEHTDYPLAMKGLNCAIEHRTTSSKDLRDRNNELFEINSLDRFLRHSSANHARKTIAQSRRVQCIGERKVTFVVWKNCMKQRWELGGPETPAMIKGLLDRPLRVQDILRERLFVDHYELPEGWHRLYWRLWETPVLGTNRKHELKYAR